MKARSFRTATLAACLAGFLAASACGPSVEDFTSPGALGDGVMGKQWQTPYFLDGNLYAPGSQSSANLFKGYDAVAVDAQTIQLGVTFKDPLSGLNKAYAREYVDGAGWAPAGSNFLIAAADGGTSLPMPAIGTGQGLVLLAGISTGAIAVAENSNGAWEPSTPGAAGLTPVIPTAPTSDLFSTPNAVALIDSLGRGYLFMMTTNAGSGVPAVSIWQPASAPAALVALDGTVSTTNKIFAARYDGSKYICVTFEAPASSSILKAACGSTLLSNFTTTTSAISTGGTTNGHDLATDGAGGFMALYYLKDSTTHYHVYAASGSAGTWNTQTQLDGAAASTVFGAPEEGDLSGARPGIAYLGGGSYMAGWVGVDTTLLTTQLYYSIYTPGTGWSLASTVDIALPFSSTTSVVSNITNQQASYQAARPPHRAIHVFSNGDGNAGIAANLACGAITSTPGVSAVATAACGTISGATGVPEKRYLYVNRWQSQNGWIAPAEVGNGCSVSSPSGYIGCTQRPTGVILPSGTTVVVYGDQDTENGGGGVTAVGNSRLAGVEFR
jgi:hypothetical protein